MAEYVAEAIRLLAAEGFSGGAAAPAPWTYQGLDIRGPSWAARVHAQRMDITFRLPSGGWHTVTRLRGPGLAPPRLPNEAEAVPYHFPFGVEQTQ